MNENCFDLSGQPTDSGRFDLLTADSQWGTRFAPAARRSTFGHWRNRLVRWLNADGRDNLMVLVALVLFVLSLVMVL